MHQQHPDHEPQHGHQQAHQHGHGGSHEGSHRPPHLPTREEMEARYADNPQLWSGQVNKSLVYAAADLAPGRVLDIGCGEGADLQWLADRGWEALGIDFAPTAVARTRARGLQAEAKDFAELGDASFDLVTCFYGGLPATEETIARLEALVAPGGRLVYVHHDFEPVEGVPSAALPEWVADNLRELDVVECARRPRHVAEGAGSGHAVDVVLIARRPKAH